MQGKTYDFAYLKKEFSRLEEKKAGFKDIFEDLGRMGGTHFNSFDDATGNRKNKEVFDGTYPLASRRYSAIVESFAMPRTERWHFLQSEHFDLREDKNVMEHFDKLTNYLFAKRYAAESNFSSQCHEALMSFAFFGTGVLFVGTKFDGQDSKRRRMLYKSIHISDVYIDENSEGIIDTLIRRIRMRLADVVEMWGEENLTENLKEIYKKEPNKIIDVYHRVAPNNKFEKKKFGIKGKKFLSQYYIAEHEVMLEEGGFKTFPYAIARDLTSPNEVWGRGPAINMLPDIKMVNQINKSLIIGTHKAVSPPILTLQDGAISRPNLAPNSIIRGGIDEMGRQMIQPFQTQGNIPIGYEMLERTIKTINDAFFVTLFQILLDTPRRTATEVLELAQEKGALLSPTLGRIQSEFLGRLIEREISLLKDEDDFPETPAVLKGKEEYKIVYDSPFNRAQKAEESTGILRAYESILPIADRNPDVLDIIDDDKAVKSLLVNGGVPAKMMRSEQEISSRRRQRSENAAQQQQAELLESGSETAKNIAQAENLRGGF